MTALASIDPVTAPPTATPSSSAPATSLGVFEIVKVKRVRENADNKRTFFGDLDGLASSMRDNNVIEPLIVRRVVNARAGDADLELVAGHRRFRAAIKAGLTHLPVIIREYTDKQVLEIQIVENLQREGLHPLDEAEGFADLISKHGYTVATLAEKVGVSKGTIHARLKLRSLGDAGRTALRNGEIDESRALALARVPPGSQAKALKEILKGPFHGDGPMTAREAQEWISNHYTIRLSERACFSLTDAALLPKAGDCQSCPKRSGNMPDAPSNMRADVCTDPGCFGEKVDATWKLRAQQAPKFGLKVIGPAESKKIFERGQIDYRHTKYALLDTRAPEVGHRPWSEVLKKPPAPNAIARDDRGAIVELYEVAALVTAAKAAGIKTATRHVSKPFDNKRWQEQQKKRATAERAKRAKSAAVAHGLASRAMADSGGLWPVLAMVIARQHQYAVGQFKEVLGRYGATTSPQLIAKASMLAPAAARALIVEVLVVGDHGGDDTKALCAYLDPKNTIASAAASAAKDATAAAKKAPPKMAAAKATPKKTPAKKTATKKTAKAPTKTAKKKAR